MKSRSIKKNRFIVLILFGFMILFLIIFYLDYYHFLPKKTYTDEDFGISYQKSGNDYDQDEIDDYIEMLNGARKFVSQKPKYKSEYYDGGYPPKGVGVCTDVVAQAFLEAGYDLRELVDQDIRENRESYPNIEVVDKNIDYRRVRNLKIFLKRNAISFTTDIYKIDQWQAGDIVVFQNHIGIISDQRNKKGIPYLIHHGGQPVYEEDVLKRYEGKVVGHYRFSFKKD